MYLTLAIAVGALYLGGAIKQKVPFFERFCIPAPVIGGGIISILVCILHVAGIVDISFDETLKDICMIVFFTSVGYSLDVSVFKSGGKMLVRLIVIMIVIAFVQNGMGIGLARLLNVDTLVGMCTGSIPLLGGHGTSAAFGTVLEGKGLNGATTFCLAAATYGLIAGGLVGGPVAGSLIKKYDLLRTAKVSDDTVQKEKKDIKEEFFQFAPAACHIAVALGIGSIVSWLISKTGMIFPDYIGGLVTGAVIRNVGMCSGKYKVYADEVNKIGGVMLEFFLGIALITMKIWLLADLAVPLIIMLAAQTLFMIIFARFAMFRILGGDYDAAVLTAGVCGFGLGATPVAMANIQSVTYNRLPSNTAYILIPITGSFLNDIINSTTILFFINLIS